MKKNFKKLDTKLIVNNDPRLIIRLIKIKNIETLRNWKNQNKKFFFTKKIITISNQKKWFQSYNMRIYDFMFIVSFKGENFGCMGIRWQKNYWEIYNVILGNKKYRKKGYMGKAFKIMINFAIELKIGLIKLHVMKRNPAIKWYKKQGLKIINSYNNYHIMML